MIREAMQASLADDRLEFLPPPEKTRSRDEEPLWDAFLLDGRPVTVALSPESANIRYENGSEEFVDRDELAYCPDCVREHVFPFQGRSTRCPAHGTDVLAFDLDEYERFELLGTIRR